jgi:hypothetical protein
MDSYVSLLSNNKDSFFDPPVCEVNSTNYISNYAKSQGTFGGLRMVRPGMALSPQSKEGSFAANTNGGGSWLGDGRK